MAILLTLHLVAGIAAVTHGTCNAAAVDATPPDRRAQAFGLLRAAFMDGFILGPVTGSLLGESGPRAPFWAAAALAGANLVFGWFALPEAVTDETRRSFKPARVNPLGALRSVSRLSGAAPLLAIIFLTQLAFISYIAVRAFWGKAAFGWSTTETGLSLAAFGLGAIFVQAWGVRLYLLPAAWSGSSSSPSFRRRSSGGGSPSSLAPSRPWAK